MSAATLPHAPTPARRVSRRLRPAAALARLEDASGLLIAAIAEPQEDRAARLVLDFFAAWSEALVAMRSEVARCSQRLLDELCEDALTVTGGCHRYQLAVWGIRFWPGGQCDVDAAWLHFQWRTYPRLSRIYLKIFVREQLMPLLDRWSRRLAGAQR